MTRCSLLYAMLAFALHLTLSPSTGLADEGEEAWRTDVAAFDKHLAELTSQARVPAKDALEGRVTLRPGGGKLNTEVMPITDGAGGFVDLKPAADTVQAKVNQALRGRTVTWELELAADAAPNYLGLMMLQPKLATEDAFLVTIILKPRKGQPLKAGDRVKLEGTIGDASRNKGMAFLTSPSGPIAIYHLDAVAHTVFWLALTKTTVTRLEPTVDPRLAAFVPGESRELTGEIRSIGSDLMQNVMTLWFEAYRGHYPHVRLALEGKGGSSAPDALLAGLSPFAPMSRRMTARERAKFREKFGYEPTPTRVASDRVAVFVHPDNPIAERGLTLAQLEAIYARDPAIPTWGDLGLDGAWKDQPISRYGPNRASGTHGYFQQQVLSGGEYTDEVKEQPGGASIVTAVGKDRFGIGYTSLRHETDSVVVVPLAATDGGAPVAPLERDDSAYPLRRDLYLYYNLEPGSSLPPPLRELARLIYSREGQRIVVQDGFLPIRADIAAEDGRKIGLEIELGAAAPAKSAR